MRFLLIIFLIGFPFLISWSNENYVWEEGKYVFDIDVDDSRDCFFYEERFKGCDLLQSIFFVEGDGVIYGDPRVDNGVVYLTFRRVSDNSVFLEWSGKNNIQVLNEVYQYFLHETNALEIISRLYVVRGDREILTSFFKERCVEPFDVQFKFLEKNKPIGTKFHLLYIDDLGGEFKVEDECDVMEGASSINVKSSSRMVKFYSIPDGSVLLKVEGERIFLRLDNNLIVPDKSQWNDIGFYWWPYEFGLKKRREYISYGKESVFGDGEVEFDGDKLNYEIFDLYMTKYIKGILRNE